MWVENDPINWLDPDGLSKTEGIKRGEDAFYKKLKDASGDRDKIREIEKDIKKLKDRGNLKANRLKKLKAWLKMAKDGRLLKGTQPFVLLPGQTEYLERELNKYRKIDPCENAI